MSIFFKRGCYFLAALLLLNSCNPDGDEDTFDNQGPLTITVKEDYLRPKVKGWIFTNDPDGEVMEVREFSNGDVLRFDAYGKNSSITILTHTPAELYGSSHDKIDLTTFMNLETANLVLQRFSAQAGSAIIGEHTAVISNITPPYVQVGVEIVNGESGNRVPYNQANPANPAIMTTKLYESPTKLLYTLRNSSNELIVHPVDVAQIGETIELDASDFTAPQTIRFQFDEFDYAFGEVYYLRKPNDYAGARDFGLSFFDVRVNDELLLGYPDFDAPEFITRFDWGLDYLTYYYTYVGDQPAQQYKQLDASASGYELSDDEISVSITGNVDVVSISLSQFENELLVSWTIYDEQKSKNVFITPQLPNKIRSKYNGLKKYDFKFYNVEMEDAIGVTGYHEWIESSYGNEHMYSNVKEQMRLRQDLLQIP